jgi:hypothetical protein
MRGEAVRARRDRMPKSKIVSAAFAGRLQRGVVLRPPGHFKLLFLSLKVTNGRSLIDLSNPQRTFEALHP